MNEVREQFTFYGSFFRAGKALNDKMRLQYYDAICEYALYGTMPESVDEAVCGMMEIVMPVLDAARKKALAGKAGKEAQMANRQADDVAEPLAKPLAKQQAKRLARPLANGLADKVADDVAEPLANGKQEKEQVKGQVKEQEKEKEQEQMLNNPPFPPSLQQRKTDFLRFWEAYPRKIGDKKAAFHAYCEAQMPLIQLLRAVEALKKTKTWTDEGGRFIPAPERWLREERWHEADELLKEPRNDLDLAEQLLRKRKEQSA